MLRILLVGLLLAGATAAEAADQLLFVSTAAGNPEIMLAGDEPANLTNNAAADFFPAWSPDGKRIAFVSNRDGAFNIYVMNADGSEPEKVSDEARGSAAACHCPTWSPDGESIAYQRREGDRSDLHTIHLESGRARNIAENAWDPAWSPRGDAIVFTGLTEKGWSVFTIEPDGAKRKEIVAMENRVGYVYPSWSPDGKRVAFTHPAEGGMFEIYLCDAGGGNLKQLTKQGRMNTHSVWSPDGKRVLFLHDKDGMTWSWLAADVETGKTEPVPGIKDEKYQHGARAAVR